MSLLKHILSIAAATAIVFSSFAVTDKEMEQAKAIAAQAYLRYANDGSGYLDEFKASSMSELESKLKAKEKENIKAFKSVKVPSDYASWDKEKLVEFWAVTFFTSPNLEAKGKAARTRVKQRVSAMTVAAPSTAPKEDPKEIKPTSPEPASTPQPEVSPEPSPAAEQPSAQEVIEKQEEILADQNAIAQDAEEKQYKNEDSGTWIYVVVLIILVGIVIWLVVFAANMMKKQPDGAPRESSKGSDNELREQFGKAMGKKNEELAKVTATLDASERDNARLMDTVDTLKAENNRLKAEISNLREELKSLKSRSAATATTTPRPTESHQQPAKAMPNVIYLGRANSRGLFVRADRRIIPGNTIYRLDTRDGLVGTFQVVDHPEITEIALSDPDEFLAGGCTALDLYDTESATGIITENAGTAIFENGCWKVLRKSRIRYE